MKDKNKQECLDEQRKRIDELKQDIIMAAGRYFAPSIPGSSKTVTLSATLFVWAYAKYAWLKIFT